MNPNLDGLFGPSPEMIGRQQYEMMRARAAQEAQMSNIDRANYGMRTAGATLGHVGAGMLGSGNPAIEEAKMREQVMAQGGDLTTSAGLKAKALQFAQAGDQRTAMKLAIAAKNMEADEAKVKLADSAEKRKEYAAKPELEKYAMAMAKRSGLTEGTPEYDDFVSTWMYEQKEKMEKKAQDPLSYREWVLAGKPGTGATDEAKYGNWIMTGKKASGTTITNVMPGTEAFKDIPKFRKDVQDTVKPQIDAIYAADKALAALNLSIKENNPSAFQVSRTQLAKLAGDSQISLREVEAAGGDPSLFGKLGDTVSVWTTGTPMIETQMNMKRTVEAIKKVAKQKGKAEIEVQRALARDAKFSDDQIAKALKFDQFEDAPTGSSTSDAALIKKHLKKKPNG